MELEQLQAAFAADPNSTAYYQLIARYVELDRVVEALVVAKKAVGARPGDATAIRTLGWVLLVQNKVDRALNELGRALQIEPGDYEARFLYALGLERLERFQEAEIQIDYVIAAHPDHPGALEAKIRLSKPKEEAAEDREQVVEKTIMMAAADILSSRDLTGSIRKEDDGPNDDQLAKQAQELVDKGLKARRDKATQATEAKAKREEVEEAQRAARRQLEEMSEPKADRPDQLRSDPGAAERADYRKKALVSLGLALVVTVVLTALYTTYSSWAASERAIQERFGQAEQAFVKHQPQHLLKALQLAEALVAEQPDHFLGIGLAAHAAARLANEQSWPEGWARTEKLLNKFPPEQTSVHHRAASALFNAHKAKFGDAMAALDLSANGRKLNLAIFKSVRGFVMHRQGRNEEARKSLQSSVADGADHPELNWMLSRFEFETGHPGVAQAYAGRLLAAADQARGEALEKARAEQAKAAAQAKKEGKKDQADTPPAKVAPLAFAKIEHGPALLLRSASWLIRNEPLARPALDDLARATALPICSVESAANCLFEGQKGLGEALLSVANDRLNKTEDARAAQQRSGASFDTHPWALLARAYWESDRGQPETALGLIDKAEQGLAHSALPTLARFHAQKLMKPPTATVDGLAQLAKSFPSLKGQAMMLAAEILAKKGDKEGALARVQAYAGAFPQQTVRTQLYKAQALRWSKSYNDALSAANDTLDAAVKSGAMNLGHGALIEIMRLELRRGGRNSAKRAYKDLLKDNPNHTEALYLAASILSDREAAKHLKNVAPGSRWAIRLRQK